SEDQRSPNRWIMKMETAIALARWLIGTVSMMRVLIGPVDRNNRNIARARQAIAMRVPVVRNAASATGTAVSVESPSKNAWPAGLHWAQAVAAKPPAKVPSKPAPAVTAPKKLAALLLAT